MLSTLIEKIELQSISAITIQSAILIGNIVAYQNVEANGCFVASSVLILSLFNLQIISRRFLLLYPYHPSVHQPTPKIDTYILKLFISFAMFLLILGILQSKFHFAILQRTENIFLRHPLFLVVVIILFVPGLPMLWLFWADNKVRNCLVNDLKKKELSLTTDELCPKCQKNFQVTIKVLDQNVKRITKTCACGYSLDKDEPVNIGY